MSGVLGRVRDHEVRRPERVLSLGSMLSTTGDRRIGTPKLRVWSVLMRRAPQSPNGTIELMVSELCMQSQEIGVTRISLNFAMFRSAFESTESSIPNSLGASPRGSSV